MKRLIKEFEKEFGTVQPFDLKKNTNFYIYYYVTDENYVQFEMTRQDQENIIGRDLSSFTSDVDYKQNYSRAEIEATRQIQIEYSQELDQVNQTAAMQKQKLDDYIQSLKDEERKNALIRKELILNSSYDNTETLLY
ncbi:MAG: hypothetical protein P8H57_05695 [Emcibacteraceae bacterium]|nr:hypothetical protein [Emcibacteraceae bacterium]MDG1726626.1 hypothetical protein [Emcibacteraceae bacterium]